MKTSPTPSSPAIAVRNLSVVLDNTTILDDVSFTIPRGTISAIIGPNGAGKSILVKTILGLIPKTQGTIEIFNTPQEHYSRIAKQVSYVPQRLALDHTLPLTIYNLFSLKSPRLVGLSHDDKQRMMHLLTLVGMEGSGHQRLSQLSGGQLQRVLLAYSLMDDPKLLILDEPSAGIDIQGQETIYMLLHRLHQEIGLTVVLVSHELEVVVGFCDYVLCLNKKLFCAGVPAQTLTPEILQEMYHMPVSHFTHQHHTHG